jgi:hypothetical protein
LKTMGVDVIHPSTMKPSGRVEAAPTVKQKAG